MIIKFKNGYTVRVMDHDGQSRKEILDAAKKAVKEIDKSQADAKMTRTINTNVSFSIQRLRDAIKSGDIAAINHEVDFLIRDLEADASKEHKNYVNTFRPEVLKKIVSQYEKAIDLLKPVMSEKAQELEWKLWAVKENWGLTNAKFQAHAVIDGEAEDAIFDTIEDARQYLNLLSAKAQKAGQKISSRYIMNDLTGEIIDSEGFQSIFDAVEIPEKIDKTYLVMVMIAGGMMYLAVDGYTPRQKYARRFLYEKDAYEAGKATGLNFKIIAEDRKEVTDAKVKDVPYFDPTDNPTIESEYSSERLKKELAHPKKGEQDLSDFDLIMREINEFIEKGSQALIDAGWSKIDARHAIAMKYYPLVKELRAAGAPDFAKQLKDKIKELEKAWDLVR